MHVPVLPGIVLNVSSLNRRDADTQRKTIGSLRLCGSIKWLPGHSPTSGSAVPCTHLYSTQGVPLFGRAASDTWVDVGTGVEADAGVAVALGVDVAGAANWE